MPRNEVLNRKIQKATDKLLGDGNLFGLDIDDVITKGRRVTASGEALNTADVDIVVNFNKQARPTDITLSFDFYDFDARMVEGFVFKNHKKFQKALKKERFENLYARAMEYLGEGTQKAFQKGVDLVEDIPGMGNMWINVISTEIPSFYVT